MSECPFTPPYPRPLAAKAGLLRRFVIGWRSWIHMLFAGSYTMKLGQVRLPRRDLYVVNEPSLVARVLEDDGAAFPKHGFLGEMLGPLIGDSVFSANGQAWRGQRAMVGPAFAHARLDRALPAMAAAAADMVAAIGARASAQPLDVDPLMTQVTADIIFRTLFSVKLDAAAAARVHAAFGRYQSLAQPAAMLGLYGLPRLGYDRRARRAAAEIHAVFAPILRERLAGGGTNHADILQSLIAARHPETGAAFGFQALLDQVSVLFLAGHETSASALSWALYLLARAPALQERLHGEILAGDGDLRKIAALRDLFREVLRLYPPVSFLARGVTAPTGLRGKRVMPGDMVVVSPWLIQRSETHWSCPHAFDPDRFARPENADAAREAWLPFGRGPRVCIGAGFAQQEALVVLAAVLRHFRLSCAPGPAPEPVSRLTLRARAGIRLIFTPR